MELRAATSRLVKTGIRFWGRFVKKSESPQNVLIVMELILREKGSEYDEFGRRGGVFCVGLVRTSQKNVIMLGCKFNSEQMSLNSNK